MSVQRAPVRSTAWVRNPLPTPAFADPIAEAQAFKTLLPGAIAQAEAAGLSMIAAHLRTASGLAERVAAARKDG